MKELYGIIYETTNIITGMKYIGRHKTTKDIFDGYLGSGTYLKNAIEKYGESNFCRNTLCLCYSEEDLNERELYYIELFDCVNDPIYYNQTEASYLSGIKGYHHSEETKEKLSESAKRRGISEETRAKMMETKSDPKYLKEFGRKISEANKGRKAINKDGIQKVVPVDEVPYYLECGWMLGVLPDIVESRAAPQRGKSRGPQSKETISKRMESIQGTIIVTKGNETKMIKPENLDEYLSKGYAKGRSDSFKEMRRDKMLTTTIIHKGNDIITVSNEELQLYLDSGWKLGNMTEEVRNKIRNKSEGRLWVQNGIEAIKIYPEQLQEYLDKDYVRGQKLKQVN